MPDPTRAESLEILEGAHRDLKKIVDQLDSEEIERPGSTGGGWSFKDLFGHLTTWEETALAAIDNWRAGSAARFSDLFATIADVDRFNDSEIERKRTDSWQEIRRHYDEVHGRLIDDIRRLSDEEWTEKRKVGDRTTRLGGLISRILGAPNRPFGHTRAHLDDLERARPDGV